MTISTTTKFTMITMDKDARMFDLHFIPTYANISQYHMKLVHVGWVCKHYSKDEYSTYIKEHEYTGTSIDVIISDWIDNEYKHTQPLKRVNDDDSDSE